MTDMTKTTNLTPGVMAGPPLPKRTRREKFREELRLLRRDGPVKYVRTLRALRRFHRSVRRMVALEGRDDD